MSSTPLLLSVDNASLQKAATLLRAGKLVAFPTETVYGLGADATQDSAVASIYAAKGRPQFNPLIIHVATKDALHSLIQWNDLAHCLADQFWPGPLTLVLPRHPNCSVSLLASAGMESLAVRVPSHPIAQQLLLEARCPIAAPSANASGKLSPTTALHVAESLGYNVDLILDGGTSAVGIESTILDLTTKTPCILRPGAVTQEQLENIIGPVTRATKGYKIVAPGMLDRHYAPQLPLRLNALHVDTHEALLAFGNDSSIKGGALRLNLSPQGNLIEAAANLFLMLRQLDQPHFSGIAVMPIENTGLGVAINDRLYRGQLRDDL